MQIKSGIDIIEVERIKSSIDEMGDNFLNRVYTENEIQYCESKKKNKYQSYAARFAVKEAAFKSISTLIKDKYSISWKNIETTNDENGRPSINLKSDKIIDKIEDIEISISHCKEYATAMVIVTISTSD